MNKFKKKKDLPNFVNSIILINREYLYAAPTPFHFCMDISNNKSMKIYPATKSDVVKHQIYFSDLFDGSVDLSAPVDVFAIGFEEMVDLNASNIVSAR